MDWNESKGVLEISVWQTNEASKAKLSFNWTADANHHLNGNDSSFISPAWLKTTKRQTFIKLYVYLCHLRSYFPLDSFSPLTKFVSFSINYSLQLFQFLLSTKRRYFLTCSSMLFIHAGQLCSFMRSLQK